MLKRVLNTKTSRFFNTNYIYRPNSLHISSRYCMSELPKGSNFGNFMGLNKELDVLRKKEIKRESSSVRDYSLIVVLSVSLIGSILLVIYFDEMISFMIQTEIAKFQLNIFRTKLDRHQIVMKNLSKIQLFIQQNPYEYQYTLDILNFFLKETKKMQSKEIVQMIEQIYKRILERNFKSAQNLKYIQGILLLTEQCIFMKHNICPDLVNLLFIQGTIKQAYIALQFYTKVCQKVDEIKGNKMLLECLEKNLKQKMKKDKEYYQSISQSKIDEEYPQILFKQQQQRRYIKVLQEKLNLVLE